MDWDKLRVFHAAADAGSFTHAGDLLGLSQSAVSRQVSALEDELAVPLFHRHARGLILTEQGELLYRTAHEMFMQLEGVKTRLTDSKNKPSGPLKVTTTVALGSNWLTPRLREFVELYPDIDLELLLVDDELDLAMREADVAIRMRKPVQPDLIQRKLFTVHLHVYASPDYLKSRGTPRNVGELDGHEIMIYGQPAPTYLNEINWLRAVGRDGQAPREPVLRVNNVHALKRAVQNGIGIAVLPDYIVEPGNNLVQLLPDTDLPEFVAYFVYPEELRNSARVNVFRDFLLAKAKNWMF